MSMRKLAVLLPLALLSFSCSSFTWQGQSAGVTEEQKERGLKDIATLTREYETENYWAGMRAKRDMLVNAWGRDFAAITTTIDRHLFNASPTDPSIAFPTESNYLDHTVGFGLDYSARMGLALLGH